MVKSIEIVFLKQSISTLKNKFLQDGGEAVPRPILKGEIVGSNPTLAIYCGMAPVAGQRSHKPF